MKVQEPRSAHLILIGTFLCCYSSSFMLLLFHLHMLLFQLQLHMCYYSTSILLLHHILHALSVYFTFVAVQLYAVSTCHIIIYICSVLLGHGNLDFHFADNSVAQSSGWDNAAARDNVTIALVIRRNF